MTMKNIEDYWDAQVALIHALVRDERITTVEALLFFEQVQRAAANTVARIESDLQAEPIDPATAS